MIWYYVLFTKWNTVTSTVLNNKAFKNNNQNINIIGWNIMYVIFMGAFNDTKTLSRPYNLFSLIDHNFILYNEIDIKDLWLCVDGS